MVNVVSGGAGLEARGLVEHLPKGIGFAAEPLAALVPEDRVRLRELRTRMVDAEA